MNSNKSIIRIVQDIYDFNKNKPEGIYLSINKNNLMKQHALIIGPKDTPYFGGFFFYLFYELIHFRMFISCN